VAHAGVKDLSMQDGASADDGWVVVVVSMAAAEEVELAGKEADEPAANRWLCGRRQMASSPQKGSEMVRTIAAQRVFAFY
jgi:hypothetical protein